MVEIAQPAQIPGLTTPVAGVDSLGRRKVYPSLIERLGPKLSPGPNGCIEFQGCLNNRGYGVMSLLGKQIYVHRAVWMAHNGLIPTGFVICHRCDNPACCNISHLFLGTIQDNIDDMVQKGRHHVPSGTDHPRSKLTEEQRAAVRRAHSGGESYESLAIRYGVSSSLIGSICRHEVGRYGRKITPPSQSDSCWPLVGAQG